MPSSASTPSAAVKNAAASKTDSTATRPPVVVVMGHIDHGKSTLLDYIRKTNIVDKEVGGITQRMSAYEVLHEQHDGKKGGKKDGAQDSAQNDSLVIKKPITFLDTPGHESFNAMRARGALSADIAILIVSAEDAVKPQTLDAYRAIKSARLPFLVGISKIDKPNASVDKVNLSLAENEIYVEGYGGEIPFVPFSGKTGEGIDDLLDMVLLTAEVEGFSADPKAPAECIVIEANRDNIRGISATLIIKDGTLRVGDVLVSGMALSSVRMLEDFTGKAIKEAGPSKPVRVIGWSEQPEVGGLCFTFSNKKEAEKFLETEKERIAEETVKKESQRRLSAHELLAAMSADSDSDTTDPANKVANLSLIIKGDTSGTLEAVKYEISKIKVERVNLKIIQTGIGDISENDVKLAGGKASTLIVGFNTKVDNSARQLALRMGIQIETFDIIYKLTEWLQIKAEENIPKRHIEEETGRLKILKIFSTNKDKQVIGGRVETGTVHLHDRVKIVRRESEIGKGHIRELQQTKNKVGSVEEGKECGLMVESKIELAPGDHLIAYEIVLK